MSWYRIAAPLLVVAASAAHAQQVPDLSLEPGEAVTVRLGVDGRPSAVERLPARWSRFDLFAARYLAGMTPPDAPVDTAMPLPGGNIEPDPIPADEVRIRFLSIADQHALLVIENGSALGLTYRARMTDEGRSAPTDVCLVLPRLPSYEHWPHRIERIDLSDFRFVPWDPTRAPPCR